MVEGVDLNISALQEIDLQYKRSGARKKFISVTIVGAYR